MIVCLNTLQSLMDDEQRDVIAEVFADSDLTHADIMQSALWARYRYSCIGSACVDRWIRVMRDRLTLIGGKWDDIIDKALTEHLADTADMSYERIIKHTAIDGGDTRTISHAGSDQVISEREDLPQTQESDRFISSRDTSTSTPGVTDTERYAPNTQDSEQYTQYAGLAGETFARMMREYPSIPEGFADEFSAAFVDLIV